MRKVSTSRWDVLCCDRCKNRNSINDGQREFCYKIRNSDKPTCYRLKFDKDSKWKPTTYDGTHRR